jgi:Zn-dependent membrane protease YugP
MFRGFDPYYFLFVAPAVLLGMWAQWRIRTACGQAGRMPAALTGAAAARHILDSAGLHDVRIEVVPGRLTDHYDPRARVLRLSEDIYYSRSLAAVGIAAHEAGHALQDARAYAPLVIRNLAVPLANIGSNVGILLLVIGAALSVYPLVILGIAAFSGVVLFQLVNLPVEFNASRQAKAQLAQLGIVGREEMRYVDRVLGAAAMTYVAATLQAILTLAYFIVRFAGRSRRE